MKRITATIMLMLLLVSLAACDTGEKESAPPTGGDQPTETVPDTVNLPPDEEDPSGYDQKFMGWLDEAFKMETPYQTSVTLKDTYKDTYSDLFFDSGGEKSGENEYVHAIELEIQGSYAEKTVRIQKIRETVTKTPYKYTQIYTDLGDPAYMREQDGEREIVYENNPPEPLYYYIEIGEETVVITRPDGSRIESSGERIRGWFTLLFFPQNSDTFFGRFITSFPSNYNDEGDASVPGYCVIKRVDGSNIINPFLLLSGWKPWTSTMATAVLRLEGPRFKPDMQLMSMTFTLPVPMIQIAVPIFNAGYSLPLEIQGAMTSSEFIIEDYAELTEEIAGP